MGPVVIRAFVRPLAIEPGQVFSRWRWDSRRLRQSRQKSLVTLSRVAPHNTAKRGICFKGCRVHAHRLTVDQSCFRKPLQNPAKHRCVRFNVDQPPRSRNRRMVRRRLVQFQPQKSSHTQRVGGAPSNPSFRFDLFEKSQHQQSKITPRYQTRSSHRARVEFATRGFYILVKTVLIQHPVERCVKGMRRASRQILRRHPHRLLTKFSFAFTHGHARTLR